MRCSWCGNRDTKVVDSRPADDESTVRRRRECARCGRRFTTFERSEAPGIVVIKRDGSKEPYAREKVTLGIEKAIKNRPVSREQVRRIAERVEERLRRRGPEVTTQEVGLEVLGLLGRVDEVAYMRFASVYKDFQQITDFERELGLLLQKKEPKRSRAARK